MMTWAAFAAVNQDFCPHPAKGTSGEHHWRPEYKLVHGEAVGQLVCAYCGKVKEQ